MNTIETETFVVEEILSIIVPESPTSTEPAFTVSLRFLIIIGTTYASADAVATACTGYNETGVAVSGANPSQRLQEIDKVINEISKRTTTLGAAQNRIDSAIESIAVQSENITSSLSTLRDADISKESSNYIKAQILQQASATLLSTANQSPSIALNLI